MRTDVAQRGCVSSLRASTVNIVKHPSVTVYSLQVEDNVSPLKPTAREAYLVKESRRELKKIRLHPARLLRHPRNALSHQLKLFIQILVRNQIVVWITLSRTLTISNLGVTFKVLLSICSD